MYLLLRFYKSFKEMIIYYLIILFKDLLNEIREPPEAVDDLQPTTVKALAILAHDQGEHGQ